MKTSGAFYRLAILVLFLAAVSTSKAEQLAGQNGWHTGLGTSYVHLESEFPTLPPQDTVCMQLFTGIRYAHVGLDVSLIAEGLDKEESSDPSLPSGDAHYVMIDANLIYYILSVDKTRR